MNKQEWINLDELLNDYAELKITKRQFYQKIGSFDKLRCIKQTQLNYAEKYRANKIQDRKLEVVYMTGNSGSGKTTAGKYFANKKGYDAFISGSGEDILDGYDKEECIILDDFRGGSMRFSELLKFLDNNTNSSVRSRYYNKDISNCKLIIITSIYKPDDLYSFMSSDDENSKKEPAEQLYRRLKHHYFEINNEGKILEYKLNESQNGVPTGRGLGNINDIYKELGIEPNKVDDTSIMDEFMCEDRAYGDGDNVF